MKVESVIFSGDKVTVTWIAPDGRHCQTEFTGDASTEMQEHLSIALKMWERIFPNHTATPLG